MPNPVGTLFGIPYERIIQWTAGPIAAFAGWIATKLVTNSSFLGSTGLGKSQVAHAIVVAVTFGVTALLTYMAHHKWLSNLPKWWDAQARASATMNYANTTTGTTGYGLQVTGTTGNAVSGEPVVTEEELDQGPGDPDAASNDSAQWLANRRPVANPTEAVTVNPVPPAQGVS